MSDQTIEQPLEISLRDVFFKGRKSMELEIETKGRAIQLPIASEIATAKAMLLQFLNEARIDENKMYVHAIETAGLHEPDAIGVKTFKNRIETLTTKDNK